MQAVTDVSGTAVAGALGRGANNMRQLCSPGGTAYSLDSGTYIFQARVSLLHATGGCNTMIAMCMQPGNPTCISVSFI